MNQGQQAPPTQAPPAQPAAAAAPPVLPAPQPPPPAGPAQPAPAFALGPGCSHAVLNFDDPNTGATATKLYNKAISPLDTKFDGEADNLAVFLASVRDRAHRFNWQRLIAVPIDNGTTRNLLTHYGQVSLDDTRAHATTYVNTPTRDAQDNDMFYYFLADSLTSDFRTTVLLYADVYTVTNIPVASALLKQIIILTRVDNPASTMHIREMLIESKSKLLLLKGNITQFNQWVRKQMGRLHAREQDAIDLLYYLWKAYKAAPDDEFVVYIKDLKSQSDDGRATSKTEDLMVRAENKYEARLLDEENTWGKPTEELEKIVAMTRRLIPSRKRAAPPPRPNRLNRRRQRARRKRTRKLNPRRQRNKRKRRMKSGHGRTRPQRIPTAKKITLLLRTSKAKSINGACTTIMEWACGPCITQTTVKQAKTARHRPPTLTSLPSTLWIAILNENDYCARTKCPFGSG